MAAKPPRALSRAPAATAERSPNSLLAALPGHQYQRLLPMLETVPLQLRSVLHKQGAAATRVFFPSGGMCSLMHTMADGRAVEVGSVGVDGIVNVAVMFGSAPQEYEALVQIAVPGMSAQSMSAEDFRRETRTGAGLHDVVTRYVQAFMTFSMQSTACNGLHSVDERCARWLLMCADRAGGDTFQLTQEFLSVMLGVRRATVTITLGTFQRRGLIEVGRKRLTILDRPRLLDAACECYALVHRYYRNVRPPVA